MEVEQALRVHRQLAHRLLPFWYARPQVQLPVQSRLRQWDSLQLDDVAFFGAVAADLEAAGIRDYDLLAAVRTAGEEPVDEHIAAMFSSTLGAVQRLYDQYGRWAGGDPPSFDLLACRDAPHPEEFAYCSFGVSANTEPARSNIAATVEVWLALALLGPPTWASIPYVLFHELTCHASQGAPSSDATDPFTDGWMDLLASEVHLRHVGDVFPWDAAAARREGTQLCETIRQLGSPLNSIETLARQARVQGVEAGRRVRLVLAELSDLRPDSDNEMLFQELSIQLNILPPLSLDETARHRRFIGAVLDPDLETRRNAIIRKWVLGTALAAEVLEFM